MSGHIRDPFELVGQLGLTITAGAFQLKCTILFCSVPSHDLASISTWPQLHREDCKTQDMHTVIPKLEIFAQPLQTGSTSPALQLLSWHIWLLATGEVNVRVKALRQCYLGHGHTCSSFPCTPFAPKALQSKQPA